MEMDGKLPLRRRKRPAKANGKANPLGFDEQLTPAEACRYMAARGVHVNRNILALLRRDGKGPPYLKIGRWVRSTPRFLEDYIEVRKPRLIDPVREAS